ncbi:unnamed protein product [Trichogramma brassicae]|uniref:Uncharacterized protein n=1 Tax=Trichogramma brassicae TaxID=86971 RepID=A0A6H5J319_9HYME|nr:unnamed protein product [Trichogramma brassicae]
MYMYIWTHELSALHLASNSNNFDAQFCSRMLMDTSVQREIGGCRATMWRSNNVSLLCCCLVVLVSIQHHEVNAEAGPSYLSSDVSPYVQQRNVFKCVAVVRDLNCRCRIVADTPKRSNTISAL